MQVWLCGRNLHESNIPLPPCVFSAHTIPEFRSNSYLPNPTIIACCSVFHLPGDHCAFLATVSFSRFVLECSSTLPCSKCLHRPLRGFNGAQNTPQQASFFALPGILFPSILLGNTPAFLPVIQPEMRAPRLLKKVGCNSGCCWCVPFRFCLCWWFQPCLSDVCLPVH